jgi:copper(I)-binding protein
MKKSWVVLLLSVLFLAACSSGGSGSGELEVSDVWGRTSPMAAQNGAFYMTITNNTGADERLLAAAADVCGTTELHEMYMKEGDVMGMRPVSEGYVEIPAGEIVALKVGGLHVMCIDKKAEFKVGDQIPLTLTFANAGERTVTAEIKEGEMGG